MSLNMNIYIENQNYIIKTADQEYEYADILKLRSNDLNAISEFDKYDLLADHILLKEKKSTRRVGTYRILHSDYTDRFSSEEKFSLDDFLTSTGAKVEMGSFYLEQKYQNTSALSLMWQALTQYCSQTKVDYLFGHFHILTTCPAKARDLFNHFKKEYGSLQFNVKPLPSFDIIHDLESSHSPDNNLNLEHLIHPLLKYYLKSGARIYGLPAIDRVLKCIDFFTILKMIESETVLFSHI